MKHKKLAIIYTAIIVTMDIAYIIAMSSSIIIYHLKKGYSVTSGVILGTTLSLPGYVGLVYNYKVWKKYKLDKLR